MKSRKLALALVATILLFVSLCSVLTRAAETGFPATHPTHAELTSGAKIAQLSPQWTPDGTRIVFGHYSHLYSVSREGSQMKRITEEPSRHAIHGAQSPSVSPDGSHITYNSFRHKSWLPWGIEHEWEIVRASLDGSNERRLTRATDYKTLNSSPIWSPDGTQIAFVSIRGGVGPHLYTMDTDGSNLQNIAPSTSVLGHLAPMWSHDGTRIAFVGVEFDSSRQQYVAKLHVVRRDGTELTGPIELPGHTSAPSWSPDDSRIAIVQTSEDRSSALYLTTVDGSAFNMLVDFGEVNRPVPDRVQWSPDGTKILVSGSGQIISVNSDGSEPVFLNTPGLVHDTLHASWSPDGSQIAGYIEDSRALLSGERYAVLFTINADGTDGRILVHSRLVSRWSPFGKTRSWEPHPTHGEPWTGWPRGDSFPIVTPEPSPVQGSNSAPVHERESFATAVHSEPTVLDSEKGAPVRPQCQGREEERSCRKAVSPAVTTSGKIGRALSSSGGRSARDDLTPGE